MANSSALLPTTVFPSNAGAAFVGPHVFEAAKANSTNPQDSSFYLKALEDAEKHNLQRLKESQIRAWVPPTFTPVSSTKSNPNEARLAPFTIYDAKNSENVEWNPKNIVRKKGDPALGKDQAVDGAYKSIVDSLWFFLDGLGINSIDAKGLALKAAVHVGDAYNNAYYVNGTINLGDGDGKIFHKFAEDLTVIAHELGHGIVEMVLGGLTYWSQSGALNESMADILGISALQYALGQESTKEANWLIGGLAMVPYKDKAGKEIHPALRSMSNPGKGYVDHPIIGTDPQPDDMVKYYSGSRDNYGVHINSGIPNRAFYLAATTLGGWSKDTVLKVWLEATKLISKNANFKNFAEATLSVAKKLFPSKPEVHQAIESAWGTVKVLGKDAQNKEPEAFRINDLSVLRAFKIDLSRYTSLAILLDNSDLGLAESDKTCLQKVSPGFKVNKKGEAELVIIVYADTKQSGVSLPKKFRGYEVVVMDQASIA